MGGGQGELWCGTKAIRLLEFGLAAARVGIICARCVGGWGALGGTVYGRVAVDRRLLRAWQVGGVHRKDSPE